MHQKRSSISTKWSVPRKGTKYVAVSHAKNKGMPLVVILRDILKIAQTRKEARYIVLNGDVKINYKIRKDEKFPVQIFDIVNLDKLGKNYRLDIIKKKFSLKEVSGKEAEKKIVKIIGKITLKNKNIQINLEDGQNFITKDKFSFGDSAVLNLKTNKIERILELKPGSDVEIILGKHTGEKGKLKEIIRLEREKRYVIKLKDKEVNLPAKAVLAIE